MTPNGHRENATASAAGTSECRRCGTCCRKGGPALHLGDRHLVKSGALPLRHLVTLRAGEPVLDNVKGLYIQTGTDIIKIGSKGESTACRYLDTRNRRCRIYDHRPLECRVLACWDSAPLERIYHRNRLTREDLMAAIDGLWGLIEAHQARCDYHRLGALVQKYRETRAAPPDPALYRMLRYDLEFRRLLGEKSPATKEMLDFLLGLPLIRTIRRMGIRVEKTGPDQYRLYDQQ